MAVFDVSESIPSFLFVVNTSTHAEGSGGMYTINVYFYASKVSLLLKCV